MMYINTCLFLITWLGIEITEAGVQVLLRDIGELGWRKILAVD